MEFKPETHREDYTKVESDLALVKGEISGDKEDEVLLALVKRRAELEKDLNEQLSSAYDNATEEDKERSSETKVAEETIHAKEQEIKATRSELAEILEAASLVKNKEYLQRVGLMKEVIKGLPLEYIHVTFDDKGPSFEKRESARGVVLLKIDGTDMAFLVGDDLKEYGSSYKIEAKGKEIHFHCGCGNCSDYGVFGSKHLGAMDASAKENGVKTIISRRYERKETEGVTYVELQGFITDLFDSYRSDKASSTEAPKYPWAKTLFDYRDKNKTMGLVPGTRYA